MIGDQLKMVTIGGGSTYTPELIEGIIKRYDHLPIGELWLVDIPEGREKLRIVGGLAQRMVEHAGIPMKVILTEDRREALKDADFVTTQIRVGQLPARVLDERIPLSHGLIGQETNGAGGMFKCLRTVPVILDFVRDIQELCPDAWMINFTNPSGMVEEAVLNYTDFDKVIGLCNVPINVEKGIADILGEDPKDVELQLQGMNHFIFTTDVFVNGISRMDEVIEAYTTRAEKSTIAMKNFAATPYSPEFIRGIKAIPCPYHDYYFHTKEQTDSELKEFSEGNVRGEVVMRIEKELLDIYQNAELHVKPKQLEERGGALYSDAACNLIDSIYNDKKDIQYVNVRNNGAVEGLPNSCAIEAACRISRGGATPLATGALRPEISGYVHMIKAFERMCVKAAVTGDRDLAVAALDMNPLCTTDNIAKVVVDEMMEAHKQYLPQFFK